MGRGGVPPDVARRAAPESDAGTFDRQNDKWLVGHRYLSNHSLEAVLDDYKKDNTREEARELTPA